MLEQKNTLPNLCIQMDKNTLKMYKIQLLGVQFSSIFAITPQLYMFFTLKVSHMAIDTAFHFMNTSVTQVIS